MTYYIGYRFGWVRVLGHTIAWHDAREHPYLPGRRVAGPWKVWVR